MSHALHMWTGVFSVALHASLIAVAGLIVGWHRSRIDTQPRWLRTACWGGIFAVLAAVTMLHPTEPLPGLKIDLRAAMIALATIFGGWAAGLVTTLVALAIRASIDGPMALTGMIAIAFAFVGAAVFVRVRIARYPITLPTSLTLGMLVGALGPLASFVTHDASAAFALIAAGALPQIAGTAVAVAACATIIARADLANRMRDELIVNYEKLADLTVRLERRNGEYVELATMMRDRLAEIEAIFAAAPLGLVFVDRDLRIVRINERLAAMHGLPVDAHLGQQHRALFPEMAATIEPLYRRVLETGEPIIGLETRDRTRAQPEQERDWLVSYFPPRGPDGSVLGVVAVIQDITDVKRAQAALHDSEQRFHDFADVAADWFWELDANLRTTMSTATEALAGRDGSALLGLKRWEMPGVDPEDAVWKAHRADLEAHRPFRDVRLPYRDTQGRLRYARANGKPCFAPDGTFLGYRSTSRDVTDQVATEEALRANEALLRTIADNLPVLISYVDEEERFRFVNRTVAAWYGRAPEAMLGLSLRELLDPAQYASRQEWTRGALSGREARFEAELQYPDGSARRVDSHYLPHLIDGRVRGYFAFTMDVTDRVLAEEQLRQAQKMEAVGQLTGGLAHDFNNLLAVILGNLDLLGEDLASDGPHRRKIAAATQAAERGSELTHRLLAFGRRQSLRPEVTNLAELVTGMAELMRRTLGRQIAIEIRLPGELWPVMVDRNQLENAILNVALNARDAMPTGGHLVIEADNVGACGGERDRDGYPASGPCVMLTVRDTGTGMPPDVLSRVFEPFFTTKAVGKGSGLGLSMVYGFVKQSGGHLCIDSIPGHGTSVRFFLPPACGATADPVREAPTQIPRGRGETVLIVEDAPDVRDVCVTLLERLGYRTLTAGDGLEALSALSAAQAVDLMLSDVVLPGGLSGPEVAAAARHLRPNIKVLLMSGYAVGVAPDGNPLPPDIPLIGKPFEFELLARSLRTGLDAPVPASSVIPGLDERQPERLLGRRAVDAE